MSTKFSDQQLRECFDAMDTDKSGYVCCKELAAGLEQLDMTSVEAEECAKVIMASDDKNGDDKISFEEFKTGMMAC